MVKPIDARARLNWLTTVAQGKIVGGQHAKI